MFTLHIWSVSFFLHSSAIPRTGSAALLITSCCFCVHTCVLLCHERVHLSQASSLLFPPAPQSPEPEASELSKSVSVLNGKQASSAGQVSQKTAPTPLTTDAADSTRSRVAIIIGCSKPEPVQLQQQQLALPAASPIISL